jgi:ADP-L-glycero-D-manno-heptose 6-epimerase
MYYVITGAAGFIGSNLVRALNERGVTEIIAVDNLTQADKFANLADCEIADYLDKDDFLQELVAGRYGGDINAILHQGACSDTTASDGRYVMRNNYRYSRELLEYCIDETIPLLYASSAAVYGRGPGFGEEQGCESPLNVYGYSKLLFDRYVRGASARLSAQVVGLRYFNVYGPRERHKGRMASVALHLFDQYRAGGRVRLFAGSGGYGDGEQQRDFVHVDDVVKVLLYFLERPQLSGIYNCGTGAARAFNEVALAVVNGCRGAAGQSPLALDELRAAGTIEYFPMPGDLAGRYQNHTRADLARLREAGYEDEFTDVAQGVASYVGHLLAAT